MKDLPHHMKKLNRQVIRSEHREQVNEEVYSNEVIKAPAKEQTMYRDKKRAKQRKKSKCKEP